MARRLPDVLEISQWEFRLPLGPPRHSLQQLKVGGRGQVGVQNLTVPLASSMSCLVL